MPQETIDNYHGLGNVTFWIVCAACGAPLEATIDTHSPGEAEDDGGMYTIRVASCQCEEG